MTKIQYQEQAFERNDGETVLDVLHNNDVPAPFSCRRGVCHSCMLEAVEGEVPERAQEGLSITHKQKNYFLACLCWPKSDMTVALPQEEELCMRARVVKRDNINDKLCRLFLQTEKPMDFRPGQFVNIHKGGHLVRSYSIASMPQKRTMLELHIKRVENGEMSNWLLDEVKAGTIFEIQGPNGDCFYQPGKPEQPILLVGTGTGLAPLLGIAREALSQGHGGPIELYHGSSLDEGLYCGAELQALADEYSNFSFHTCLSREEHPDHRYGRASDLAFEDHPDLSAWAVYLCGEPAMVKDAQRLAVQAGADGKEVYVDPYEHS